ncbi:MAG: cupin domain-containing protein [Burkholderia sp.]
MTRRYPAALLLASTQESKDGNRTSDFTSYTSPDKVFQTGVYQSGPVREEIREAPGTPYTEFLYFLSGGVKLTPSDGTVMQVRAGEAVTLPKGWTGVYESSGYTKLYALYDPSAAEPAGGASGAAAKPAQ